MSGYKQHSNEKGFVLVLALLITAILFLMVVALSYNTASYLRIFASTKEKTQTYYADIAGTEEFRNFAWNEPPGYRDGCFPANQWCGLINNLATEPLSTLYLNRTNEVTGYGDDEGVPFGDAVYKIYFKDNEDAYSNPTLDEDGLVLLSVVAENPNTQDKTVSEAMLIFDEKAATGGYRQGNNVNSDREKGLDRGGSASEYNKITQTQ